LLYYAEFGNTRLKREWTDLNHILQGSLVSLKALIDESKATININSSLPMVDCDPVAILEVFNNLIANAIKYRRFNEPCIITIGWTEKYTDLDNKEEIIYIQDNGVGIPEPLYERIFMPFKRFHTLSNNKGFGLGLTIVAEIIRLHSGRIWVESKIDHGSTFYFTLQSSKSKVKHAL
jgi:light-regulated signal transduction histidine kinase (bacteriophytochrome)